MNADSTGLVLHSREGTRWFFDPGALCLEFLTTGGPDDLARFEVLHNPEDLTDWLALSRLRLSPASVSVSSAELQAAHRLRDALWGLARETAHGRLPGERDVAEVNRAAAGPSLVPQIGDDGTHSWQPSAAGGQALSAIARDAVGLFTGRLAARVRECGAHDCFLIFVDASRPGQRRWCAMERCGNRHKVRALRARREKGESLS
ncbi:MAG TPA: CGNR zinc finger domain-containing protein [Streptomyces sp.]|nr:CGNR zinc finger domain-containing protein [Streptomyces sp.]